MKTQESIGIIGTCVVCVVGFAVLAVMMISGAYLVFFAEQLIGYVQRKWPLEIAIFSQATVLLGMFLTYRKLYWLEYQNNLRKSRR